MLSPLRARKSDNFQLAIGKKSRKVAKKLYQRLSKNWNIKIISHFGFTNIISADCRVQTYSIIISSFNLFTWVLNIIFNLFCQHNFFHWHIIYLDIFILYFIWLKIIQEMTPETQQNMLCIYPWLWKNKVQVAMGKKTIYSAHKSCWKISPFFA